MGEVSHNLLAGFTAAEKSQEHPQEQLNVRALPDNRLITLTRHLEDRIIGGVAGGEEYDAYLRCQLERERRAQTSPVQAGFA